MSNIGYEDPSLNNANSLLNTDIPVFDNAVPTISSVSPTNYNGYTYII